ncbi:HD domain-containing protein [Aliigemmobacter aestuarii]|nr:HD domain-containing protein [Gemmobacter aestuarii]
MDDRIAQAEAFARKAHAGQTRKGEGAEPYDIHIEEVAALVARFGGADEVIMAAWLHDTIEDCAVDEAEIRDRFGAAVAAMVVELTDDKGLPKAERKRLQVVNAPGKSAGAALVKLCDKMSNVRAVGATPPVHWPVTRRIAYLDWAETVVAALPGGHEAARAEFAACLAASRAAVLAAAGPAPGLAAGQGEGNGPVSPS